MTDMPYWIEHDENGNPMSNIWIKGNWSGSIEFYVYYGSTGALSYADGDSVFEFFDDFKDDSKFTSVANFDYEITTCPSGNEKCLHLKTKTSNQQAKSIRFDTTSDLQIVARWYPETSTTEGFHFQLATDSSSWDYSGPTYSYELTQWGWSGNYTRILKRLDNAASFSIIGDVSESSFNKGVWITSEFKRYGSSLVGEKDYGASQVTATDSDITSFQYLGYRGYNSLYYVDWVFVRKYSSTEPTISYDNEETGSWVFDGVEYTKRKKITVNSTETLTDYQIALDYNQFGEDTLYITELDAPRYPYWNQDESKIWTKVSIPAGQSLTLKIDKKDPEETPIVDNGLVAWYKLNGDATDSSGNGHNGTVYGAVATTDRFGTSNKAMNFDGSNDYINVGSANINLRGDNSLSAWIKTTNTASSDYADIVYITDNNYYLVLQQIQNTGHIRFAYDVGDAAHRLDETVKNINDGHWHHIVGISDYSNNKQKIYIDGILVASSSNAGPSGTNYNSYFAIGKHPSNIQYWNGSIDDVRIYNRALTDEEVWQLYTASQYHNGDDVFDFFDDFDGTSLDTNKWNTINGASYTISNSILTINTSTAEVAYLYTNTNNYKDLIVELRSYMSSNAVSASHYLFYSDLGITSTWAENQLIWSVFDSNHVFRWYDNTYHDVYNYAHERWFLSRYTLHKDSHSFLWEIYDDSLTLVATDPNGNFRNDTGTYIKYFSLISNTTTTNYSMDYIFFRKYSSTEPSVSVTNQGTYYEVEITNTGTSDLNDYQVAIPISTVKYQPFEIVEAEPSPEVKKRNVIINGNVF